MSGSEPPERKRSWLPWILVALAVATLAGWALVLPSLIEDRSQQHWTEPARPAAEEKGEKVAPPP